MPDSKKYIFAFIMTVVIFATAIFISNSVSEGKLEEIKNIQNRLAIDILASETQSALLEETSCKNVNQIPLTKELGELAERLASAEEQSGSDNIDVQGLKKQYFLLEIRDYLLMKKISEKCGVNPTFILYFYANEADCKDCQKMGFVLTALHEEFPDLRIYSFDYNMDLEALHTLRTIYGLGETLPALVVNGDPYYGFRPLNDLVESVPALSRLRAQQTRMLKQATSTPGTTN